MLQEIGRPVLAQYRLDTDLVQPLPYGGRFDRRIGRIVQPTMLAGVPFGRNSAVHDGISRSSPCSCAVATSGSIDDRCGVNAASGLIFPLSIPRVVLSNPRSRQTLRALRLELPTTARPLAVITLKNRFLAPVAQTFIDSARDTAALL